MMVFEVDNIGCRSCVGKITQALRARDEAVQVNVDLEAGRVQVQGSLPVEDVRASLAAIGYPARLV